MALHVIRPTKHPKTGIYRMRGRYPAELAEIYGRTEFKVSLGTKDADEARAKAPAVMEDLEKRWRRDSLAFATARAREAGDEPLDLTTRQIEALAGEIYRAYVARFRDDPGSADDWRRKLQEDLRISGVIAERRSMHGWQLSQMRWASLVRSHLADRRLIASLDSTHKLTSAVFRHMKAAHEQLLRNAEGDYTPDHYEARFPTWEAPASERTLDAIFDAYADQAELAPSTRARFKSVIKRLLDEHIRQDDFGAITQDKLITWKDQLLREGLASRTVRDVHIAAVKAACSWAVAHKRLPSNPALGVKVSVKKKKQNRTQKGYTFEEATLVLTAAARVVDDGRLAKDRYAARRWAPWLCAYSGARINEITQLRAEDVFTATDEDTVDPVWMLRITPEAGSLKTGMARDVALHSHLIEQGFLDYVRDVGKGPLFYDPGRARGGSAVHPIYKKTGERLAQWVRSLGVKDPDLAPNHGWRHRFKTICLSKGIEEVVVNRILGHAESEVGQKYGDVWPSVSRAAIEKIPRYAIETPQRREVPRTDLRLVVS